MSVPATTTAPSIMRNEDLLLFWGCFTALVTTAFGFIARMFLITTWAEEFSLDPAKSGELAGIGIWPFAVSIIGFSLLIDKIGYKMSMIIAFLGHIIWAAMGVSAYFVSQNGDKQTAFQLLYWGSLILALGNGTVEAFINPVVATMFSRAKTKWLNILHAGWPGGLVIAGMVTIFIDHVPWWIKVGLIAVPAVVYFVMLITCHFPVQERVSSGVTYRDMLSEFGVLGAAVVGFLITLQLIEFFSVGGELSTMKKGIFIGIGVAIVVGFGVYTRSAGRFLMFFMILIMMPLATTEIGTDGWITGIMEEVAKGKFHAGWVLVYTSAIMMVLRFFAGPIVHQFSPLGLLAISAVLAIVGLYTLSFTVGAMIFVAATVYALGKTFFWPTMLGVVSEQMPKGGALTLNAISGIGMLAVGVLGFPFIGTLQADKAIRAVAASSEITTALPGIVKDGKLTVVENRSIYEIIQYQAISKKKVKEQIDTLPEEKRAEMAKKIDTVEGESRQGALADMVIFPVGMLIGYLILIVYFKMRGGYQQVHLDEKHPAMMDLSDDERVGNYPKTNVFHGHQGVGEHQIQHVSNDGGLWPTVVANDHRSQRRRGRAVAMNTAREELLGLLAELSEADPELRLGQLVANLATLAVGAKAEAIWDAEDDELIDAAQRLLRHYAARQTTTAI